MTAITLSQFETIDGLFQACLNRPELETCMKHGREATQRMWFRPEWMLLDALVDALDLDYVNSFGSTIDCAAQVLTDALLGRCDVLDVEAA
jgi:hypothetical protein